MDHYHEACHHGFTTIVGGTRQIVDNTQLLRWWGQKFDLEQIGIREMRTWSSHLSSVSIDDKLLRNQCAKPMRDRNCSTWVREQRLFWATTRDSPIWTKAENRSWSQKSAPDQDPSRELRGAQVPGSSASCGNCDFCRKIVTMKEHYQEKATPKKFYSIRFFQQREHPRMQHLNRAS